MKKETITRLKLTAAEGKTLTNGEIYGKEKYLGSNGKPEHWHEIAGEECAEILKAEEATYDPRQ